MALTKLRMLEAQRVHDAFSLALSYLGYSAAHEADGLFASVNPSNLDQTAGRYLRAMKSLTMAKYDVARRLAMAYYRLMRALYTDKTYRLPGEKGSMVTLGTLREEFLEVVNEAVPARRETPSRRTRKLFRRAGLGSPIPALDTTEEDFKVEIEDFDWPSDLTEEEAADTTETRLEEILDLLEKRQKEREKKAKEAYEAAAVKQLGVIQRSVMGAGRSPVQRAIQKDGSAIGYVRASKTGDPCYFCAMLISRQVLYKSKKTALFGADGDKYHDNCNCTAVPVFSRVQYDTDPRYDLNRELNKLWKKHIEGKFSGNEARNEWRKVIRQWKVDRKLAAA